ncbi:MAG: hypothetical protein UR43_C0020G0003 [candidate division TM6 bacterium GW2011_GWF2_33_332]|nr:MAG: hypothetical protein UR43_C0020G0003 [candidate division TM6 bacterium GW2011_GWF2_33_332]
MNKRLFYRLKECLIGFNDEGNCLIFLNRLFQCKLINSNRTLYAKGLSTVELYDEDNTLVTRNFLMKPFGYNQTDLKTELNFRGLKKNKTYSRFFYGITKIIRKIKMRYWFITRRYSIRGRFK